MARTVSMDFLFYVTDFIVDELSQNAHLASEVKSRVSSLSYRAPISVLVLAHCSVDCTCLKSLSAAMLLGQE